MLDRRKLRYTYLRLSKRIKDFLLSDKSREFLIFLFFFLIAGARNFLWDADGDATFACRDREWTGYK